LIIFTVINIVDYVYINYGKDNQEALGEVTVDEMNQHIADGQFAPKSSRDVINTLPSGFFSINCNAASTLGNILPFANLKSDQLIILTAVDYVYINYGKDNQEALGEVTVDASRASPKSSRDVINTLPSGFFSINCNAASTLGNILK
jgi:carbamate kinase